MENDINKFDILAIAQDITSDLRDKQILASKGGKDEILSPIHIMAKDVLSDIFNIKDWDNDFVNEEVHYQDEVLLGNFNFHVNITRSAFENKGSFDIGNRKKMFLVTISRDICDMAERGVTYYVNKFGNIDYKDFFMNTFVPERNQESIVKMLSIVAEQKKVK